MNIPTGKKSKPAPPDKSLTRPARALWKIKNSQPKMTWAMVDAIVSKGRVKNFGEGYLYAVAYLEKSASMDLRYALGVSKPDIRNCAVRTRKSLRVAERVWELVKDDPITRDYAKQLRAAIDRKAHLRML